MAIYQLFEEEVLEEPKMDSLEIQPTLPTTKGRLFSILVTRICFAFLLLADLAYFAYNLAFFVLGSVGSCLSLGRSTLAKKTLRKGFFGIRRASICAIALLVALFSPPLGAMIGCSYFVMYDEKGIDQFVPAPLQSQIKEFWPKEF